MFVVEFEFGAIYVGRLRLIDEEGQYIVNLKWWTRKRKGEWVFQDIPEGKEIIGLQCNTRDAGCHLRRVGWVLWTPKDSY